MNILDYPVLFDETEIIRPEKWAIKNDAIKQEYQTEAGTDTIDWIRRRKLIISAKFVCDSDWAETFSSFLDIGSFTLTLYNPMTGEYDTHAVRMEDFSADLHDKSFDIDDTAGIYDVSFKLKEY